MIIAEITDQVIIGLDFLSAYNDQSINIQSVKLKAVVLKFGKRTVSVARVLLKTNHAHS